MYKYIIIFIFLHFTFYATNTVGLVQTQTKRARKHGKYYHGVSQKHLNNKK